MKRRSVAGVVAGLACALALGFAQTARPAGDIDRQSLLRDARVLSADDMQGREIDTAGGAKARQYLVERFKAAGLQPYDGSFSAPFSFAPGRAGASGARRQGANVIGHIDGTGGSGASSRCVVVSAHYNHVGVRGGQIYNGADDNASGTAALVALADYFSRHRPAHLLVFAAFDGEEAGLRGSRAFVEHPPVPLSSVVVNVNMDMIGRDPNGRLFVVGTFLNAFLKPYLERVAASAPVKLLFGHDDPKQQNVDDWTKDSDHWSFQQAGVPAVYLGDEDFEEHHKPTDDYQTLTQDFFVSAAETSLAVVKMFDANLDAIARAAGR